MRLLLRLEGDLAPLAGGRRGRAARGNFGWELSRNLRRLKSLISCESERGIAQGSAAASACPRAPRARPGAHACC
eukprot:6901864-Pyramimonas_sp.AAC.1